MNETPRQRAVRWLKDDRPFYQVAAELDDDVRFLALIQVEHMPRNSTIAKRYPQMFSSSALLGKTDIVRRTFREIVMLTKKEMSGMYRVGAGLREFHALVLDELGLKPGMTAKSLDAFVSGEPTDMLSRLAQISKVCAAPLEGGDVESSLYDVTFQEFKDGAHVSIQSLSEDELVATLGVLERIVIPVLEQASDKSFTRHEAGDGNYIWLRQE